MNDAKKEELRTQGLKTPVILVIKERFLKELDTKTSWGKNEVKALFDDITIEELAIDSVKLRKEIMES